MSEVNQPQEDEIDLKELFFTVLKYWYIILAMALLGLLLAILYLKITLPVYSTNAILQVEGKSASSDLLLGDLAGFDSKSEVSTEIEILKSRMILGEVANSLNLNVVLEPFVEDKFDARFDALFNKDKKLFVHHDKVGVNYVDGNKKLVINKFEVSDDLVDADFKLEILNASDYQISLLKDKRVLLTLKAKKSTGIEKLTSKGLIALDLDFQNMAGEKFLLKKQGLLRSTSAISSQLSASEKGKGTGILSLSMQGVHKEEITNTLNKIIDVYVAKSLEKKSAEKEKTLAFLNKQLPAIKSKLESAEARFNNFRGANKTIDVDKEAQLLLEQSIRLDKTKLELEQKRAELRTRFTDEYPLLQQIEVQLNTIIEKKTALNARLKALPEIQQQYLKMYRDVKINTELYTNLLNDYQKLKIAQSGEVGNIFVIDKAVTPIKEIKPKKALILLIGLLLGIMLGLILVFIKKLLNTGVRDATELEMATGLSVLASIPYSKIQNQVTKRQKKSVLLYNLVNQPNRSRALQQSADMAIEALRSLRTALLFASHNVKNNVIMITGASPAIGKSFVSANFAAVLAEAGKKVVVVDGDLRRGYLHQYYQSNNKYGLSNYLSEEGNEDDIEVIKKKTSIDGLDFIPRGKSPLKPANVLMSNKFQEFLLELSNSYDYVLIDSPPVLAVTDSNIIGALAGSTLVVARYDKSSVNEVKYAVDKLEASNANVVGLIFNGVRKEAGRAYDYQYGYNYKSH